MLLQNPLAVERRCPRAWTLATAGGLLSLAVLTAGVGLRAEAAASPDDRVAANGPDEPKKDEPKKDEPKKEAGKKDNQDEPKKEKKRIFGGDLELPDIEEIIKNLPQNLDPEKLAEIRKYVQQMRQRVEEMRRNLPEGVQGRFPLLSGARGFPGQGRVGIRVERPSAVLVDQLDLPKGRGLVVQDVLPDSAAAKAGLKPHDILLQFNGKAVSNDPAEFTEMVHEAKADTPFDVVVLRKGKEETVKGMSLPEMKTDPRLRRRPAGGIREILPYTPPPVKNDAVFQFGAPRDVL